MSDIKEQITKEDIYRYLFEKTQQAESFANEQVPLTIQEYLDWIFYSNLIGFIISLTIISAVFFIIYHLACDEYLAKKKKESNLFYEYCGNSFVKEKNTAQGFAYVFLILAGTPSVFGFFGCGFRLLQVTVAPRVVVLEKLSALL